jgi:glycine/D-amino acid oxidase-like deaminating enzyme
MSCSKLALCTNAFTKQFLPDLNLTPGRGLVIITKPIKKLQVEGAFHYDQGYYYFRNIENRILFGGGRNVDFETENTTIFGINKKIKEKLQEDLSRFILPNQNPVIDMEWSGIMAFGEDKNPIIKKESDTIVVGAKLGGMGVAIGSQVGMQLAELLTD